MNCPRPQSLWS